MKSFLINNIILSSLILFLTACGGGSSDKEETKISSVPAGIYEGTVTLSGSTANTALGLIASNGKVSILDLDTEEAFIGTISGTSLTGSLYSTTTVPSTAEVTNVSGNNISGTYTSSLGNGTFAFTANTNLYNRGSSLSKLAGTWVDTVFTNGTGTTTWVIQNDGTFTVASTLGCNATGALTIFNASKNEYNLSINITNCSTLNGSFTGFAVTSDSFNTDDSISLIFSNGSIGGIAEPIKQ